MDEVRAGGAHAGYRPPRTCSEPGDVHELVEVVVCEGELPQPVQLSEAPWDPLLAEAAPPLAQAEPHLPILAEEAQPLAQKPSRLAPQMPGPNHIDICLSQKTAECALAMG